MSYRDTQNPGIDLTGTLTLAEVEFVQDLKTAWGTDPNADRILFWDDSAGSFAYLTVGDNLTITGTTISASASSGASTALDNLASVAINAALVLGVSDAFALGSATKMWADLYLALGAVINFNNGDVTITHSADTLTIAGGELIVSGNITGSTLVAGSAQSILWSSRTRLNAPSDGVLTLLNNASTDFSRLQFGGTTSSFPAIKRSSAALAFRLADDSADAAITAAGATLSGTLVLGANSITMTGSLAATGARVTKGWFTDLESTNMPTVGGTALNAAITTMANLVTIQGRTVTLADAGANAIFGWDDSAGAYENLTQAEVLAVIGDSSTTAKGVIEIAIASEVTTGTDATRAVSPDALAGSDYGKRIVGVQVFDSGTDTATGDGKAFFRIPAVMNGWNLVAVAMSVYTAGTTNTTDVQIRNITQAADMLTTKLTIDSTETDSSTAATAAVIDTNNDDVATGDRIAIDVDAVHTTAAKGLFVELTFQLP